ncbi:MAG: thiamine-phosphate kinase [Chloroflexi bacterium]|nr:thiamine-phosphate kinase [Chloroflexota bacterium]
MKVSDLGEFGLIERLAAALAGRPGVASGDRLAAGIGDDAAVWLNGPRSSFATIATTDTLVADVHFLPDATPWADVGWKAIAVNVSDIAAMGGAPEFALVTLGLPASADVEQLDELYGGVGEACEAYGVVVAGGDVVRAESMFITVALCGRAELDAQGKPLALRRNAAQAGDAVAVTGCLGGAAGGLRALQDGLAESESTRALIARQRRPQARLAAGAAALAAGLRCGIDISDGLLQDLGHVCRASALGAVLRSDDLPIDPALADVFEPEQALSLAAAGGEDYELLFTGGREQIAELTREGDVPVTIIGEMVDDARAGVRLLDGAGREVELPDAGWDHLRGAE